MTTPSRTQHPTTSHVVPARAARDEGIALMSVILVLVLVGALSLTLAVITINNLSSAKMAQQAGSALNASDAGVAQAITYLRENGTKKINACSPTCTTTAWGNSENGATIAIPGKAGQTFEVWIEPLVKYPQNEVGYYRIHSTGLAGSNAGRTLSTDTEIAGLPLPIGIMAASVNGGGNASVHRESILSTGCVYKRSKIEFAPGSIDIIHNIPAAVHTSQIISDDQGSGRFCPGMSKPIHPTTGALAQRYCNTAYPNDRDRNGGPLAGTSCYRQYENRYPESSRIDSDADLFSKFNIRRTGFTRSELDQLKTIALSQQNYYTNASGWTAPTQTHSVLYFDLTRNAPGAMVNLNGLTPRWSRQPQLSAESPACTDSSLVVIIDGGNARLNSNSDLYASTFLISGDPYGNVTKANGTSRYIGTLFANNLDLTGTADLHMDECFLANPSPALTTVRPYNYREVDR